MRINVRTIFVSFVSGMAWRAGQDVLVEPGQCIQRLRGAGAARTVRSKIKAE